MVVTVKPEKYFPVNCKIWKQKSWTGKGNTRAFGFPTQNSNKKLLLKKLYYVSLPEQNKS